MRCPCKVELNLVVNTEEKKLMGYCQGCGKLYEILAIDIDPDEAEDMERRARPLEGEKTPEALFYLRCTGILR